MEALNFFVEPNRHIEQLCAAYGPRTHPLLQVNDDRSSQLIMSYRETRQSGLIPWGILAAVMVLFQFVPLFGDSVTLLRTIALLLSLLFLGLGMRRFLTPREVFIISEDEVCLQGLRPGAWKFFQLWAKVTIKNCDITKIEIGNIGAGLKQGRKELLWLDASRNAVFQNVCIVRYARGQRSSVIYYPHTDNIKDFPSAIEELKQLFGARLECF